MTMFFCHELNFACRWAPVVYHDTAPRPLTEEFKHRRSPLVDVTADCTDAQGRPILARLQAKHPAPAEAPE